MALAPGDPPVRLAVEVGQPLPEQQVLVVQWTDDEGTHTEETEIRPPRHM
jgi:hypothetical protein